MTTKTILESQLSDLPNGKVNSAILKQELEDGSVPCEAISIGGTTVRVTFSSLLSTADRDAAQAILAAHQGADFANPFQQAATYDDLYLQPPFQTTETGWQTTLDHETGPLPAGVYAIRWSSEMRVEPEAPGEDVEVRVIFVDYKGTPGEAEVSLSSYDGDKHHDFATGSDIVVANGENLKLRMQCRSSAGNSTAHMRRCRLSIFQLQGV